MQFSQRTERSISGAQDNKELKCQQCFNGLQRQISICEKCLVLLCGSCSQKHSCGQKGEGGQVQGKIQRWVLVTTNRHSYQLVPIQNSQAGRSDNNVLKSVKVTCERCNFKLASKKCLTCKIKNFCITCFRQVHNTPKMTLHQAVELATLQSFDKRSILTSYNGQFQFKRDHVRQAGYQSQLSGVRLEETQVELREDQKRKQIERSETTRKNCIVLSELKSKIELQSKTIETNMNEFLQSCSKQLDKMIQDVKLKMIQFQMRVRGKMDSSLQTFSSIIQEIEHKQIINSQLLLMIQNRSNMISWQTKIDQKIAQQIESINQLSQKEQNWKNTENVFKVSEQFYQDVELIREKINKLDFKKVVYQEEPRKSQGFNLISPRKTHGDAKNKYEVKSCKNGNSSLASYRSMDKISPLSMLLIPPPPQYKNSLNRTGRSKNDEKELLSQTVYCGSQVSQSDASTIRNSNTEFDTPSMPHKSNNPEGNIVMTSKKQSRAKGTLQKSTRSSAKIQMRKSEHLQKAGVNKAIINIQKTKRMISDMRTEMDEFNSKITGQKNKKCNRLKTNYEQSQQELSFSHISIESNIGTGRK